MSAARVLGCALGATTFVGFRHRPSSQRPPAGSAATPAAAATTSRCTAATAKKRSIITRAGPDDAGGGAGATAQEPAPTPSQGGAAKPPGNLPPRAQQPTAARQQQEAEQQLPRPPTSISGGPHSQTHTQSERAANAAAEATLAAAAAEAAAATRLRQAPSAPSPPPPPLSTLPTAPPSSPAGTQFQLQPTRPPTTATTAIHPVHRGIDSLRSRPHDFSCNEPSTGGGTLLVALDDTDNSAAAVEWVAHNLYNPGVDDLRVVHVVVDPRSLHCQTSLGTAASGRTISMDSLDFGLDPAPRAGLAYGDMEVNLRDYLSRLNTAAAGVVERRCQLLKQMGIKYEASLPLLPAARSAAGIAEALLEAVRQCDAKLLVVASHGPGALAEFGSVSRYCYQHSHVPLLLMPEAQEAAVREVNRRAAAATAASTVQPQQLKTAALAPAGAATEEALEEGGEVPGTASKAPAVGTEILLVVNHLEELADVWQWVADNCARKGDTLSIWHVAGPSLSGMPSLPTAIANQLRSRGLAGVSYKQLYSSTGDPQDLGEQVCSHAACSPSVKLVVLLNYSRRGLLQEALHGSVASHLSRHCCKPLLLLQLPE